MRPLIVEWLNEQFHTASFAWLIPAPPVMYAVAMTAVLLLYMRRSRRAGISAYHASGAALYAMVGGLLGSRLVFLLSNWEGMLANPLMILSLSGGTVSWGAYLGGLLGFWFYFQHNLSARPNPGDPDRATLRLCLLDVLGSCLGLGIFFGRWACFLNGDDFGKLSTLPWAVQYPPGSYPYMAHLQGGLIAVGAERSLPVHPVQVYLSFKGLVLLVALSWAYPRLKDRPGLTFGLFWFGYGVLRFVGEFFRGESPPVLWGVLDPAQLMCVFIVATVVVIGWLARRRYGTGFSR